MIDEVLVSLNAPRAHAGVGHDQSSARRIVIADAGKERVAGRTGAPVPITKDRA
jgi:hypothetical protein